MPSRNIIKTYVPDSYYHIYCRGVNKDTVFNQSKDYAVFLNLLKRYLSKKPVKDKQGREYIHLYGELELLSYCLMPNHFHLLIYQISSTAMQQLMHGVLTSYSGYFNKTNGRRGPLFESCYKASLISNDSYLEHISRYIHLNPNNWKDYKYSSLPYYIDKSRAEWLRHKRISNLFDPQQSYVQFLEDYDDYKLSLNEIRDELANS